MNNTPLIDLKGVSVFHHQDIFKSSRFKADDPDNDLIISGVNLEVYSGELVYLIGKVGSGKSSLLKTLYGEVPVKVGQGSVVGYDLRTLKTKQIPYLRRKLGIVFQDFQLLYDRNVYENLNFVLRSTGWKNRAEINKRIEEVLTMVDLVHKIHKMPYQLSGGEGQRLCIARALLNSPSIILADEPTGNLDPAATKEVMNIFVNITKMGCAVVMATHNLANLQNYPSRTIRFNKGVITEIDLKTILNQ